MPKIVHLVLSLEAGGLERLVCNLSARPELDDIETVVCCLDEPGLLAQELERSGRRIAVIRRRPGLDAGLIRRLASFFRRERVSALHTHSLDPMFYGGLAARLAGVGTLIHTQHDPMPARYGWKDRLKFRVALRLFDRIVAVSGQTRNVLRPYVRDARRCITILNGIEDRRFQAPPREEAGARNAGELRIGTVARLSPEKGVRVLLEAFALLGGRRAGAKLVIVGDGPERQSLEAHARGLGIAEAVEFLGFRRDIAALLGTFDVFALPSLSEGIPLALLEAMAAGLAIAATRVGGVPEVISDGNTGLLAPPGDAAALSEALAALAGSASLRREFGERAARDVRLRFSERRMAAAYRSLYLSGPRTPLWKRVLRGMLRKLPRRRIFWGGRPNRPEVAFTFDDGPDPVYTPQILEALRRFNAKATFFLVGEKARRDEALVRSILADGHEIGNHSHTHPDLDRLSWRQAAREIGAAQSVIENLQGGPCGLFRPPRGTLCLRTLWSAWSKALTVVLWTIDLKDFRATRPAEITAALDAQELSPGDVVLYHGHNPAAIAALPELLERAARNGYRAVRVSEMLHA